MKKIAPRSAREGHDDLIASSQIRQASQADWPCDSTLVVLVGCVVATVQVQLKRSKFMQRICQPTSVHHVESRSRSDRSRIWVDESHSPLEGPVRRKGG